MSPINHATTTATIGGTQWNEDHTLPTLAEIQAAGLQYLAIELTNAQIKALPSTAVELIPAQGAGTIIVTSALNSKAISDLAFTHHHVTDYAGVDSATAFLLRYASDNAASVTVGTGWLDDMLLWGAPDDVIQVPDTAAGGGEGMNGSSAWVNNALEIVGRNGAGFGAGPDYTGGNASNTLTVHIWYRVVSVA